MKKILVLATMIAVFASMLAMSLQAVQADGSVVYVNNLQPDWYAVGGGGVWSAYVGPPDYGWGVSPGTTALYDGREAGIIKAGLVEPPVTPATRDQGLFGFKPTVTIDELAAGTLTYDVENQYGENPVWMTIEIDTGVVGDRGDNTTYEFVPTTNPAGWHTVDAAAGLWQLQVNNNATGDKMSLSTVAALPANTGRNVVRAYLRLGMGDSYHGTAGLGTVAWVDKATIGTVTYDFVVNAGTASTTGTMVEGSISIIAPTLPGFGNFHAGENNIESLTDGSVTVVPGSNGNTGWSVTAASASGYWGYMWTSGFGTRLTDKFQISKGSGYQDSDTGLTYTGSGTTADAFPLWAQQKIESTDTTLGTYYITITFTASLTGF